MTTAAMTTAAIPIVDCAGVPIVACTPEQAAGHVVRLATAPREIGMDVHMCNAFTLALADKDRELHRLLRRRQAVNFPDGQAVVWANRLRYHRLDLPRQRVYGPDLLLAVADGGRAVQLRHYLLGPTPPVVASLRAALHDGFPGIDIVGAEAAPFHDLSAAEWRARIDRIAAARAQIVWTGIGTPRQDWEGARMSAELPVISVGVGAAFDFISANKLQAPLWMRQHGLEWAFRLAREPRRLWRRYLFGNAEFLRAAARHPAAYTFGDLSGWG